MSTDTEAIETHLIHLERLGIIRKLTIDGDTQGFTITFDKTVFPDQNGIKQAIEVIERPNQGHDIAEFIPFSSVQTIPSYQTGKGNPSKEDDVGQDGSPIKGVAADDLFFVTLNFFCDFINSLINAPVWIGATKQS